MEQATGIEPARSAWEAEVLPLNYACTTFVLYNTVYALSSAKFALFLSRKGALHREND